MIPNQPGSEADAPPAEEGPVAVQSPVYRWYHKLSAALLVMLCLGMGLFLVIFPWYFMEEFKKRETELTNRGTKLVVPLPSFSIM